MFLLLIILHQWLWAWVSCRMQLAYYWESRLDLLYLLQLACLALAIYLCYVLRKILVMHNPWPLWVFVSRRSKGKKRQLTSS